VQYAVIYEKSGNGYAAYVPDLPGCIAAGDTLEEVADLMHTAIEMHLEGMREDGEPIPAPSTWAELVEIS
jgi:predicted RNase H-like HicB family nuclease